MAGYIWNKKKYMKIFYEGGIMDAPIGISDSGVGGLSVVSKVFSHLPNEEILYFGDTANVPYGEKSPAEIKRLVYRILDYFVARKVKAVIMACNTSSALVLEEARKSYSLPIIGVIEPAIIEALRVSHGKKIGLIANVATVESNAHQKTMTRVSGNGVRVLPMACPGLVPLVEKGMLSGAEPEQALQGYLRPLEMSGIDTLILGCTHYPFLEQSIRKILSNPICIIDPAELTALSMKKLLEEHRMERNSREAGRHKFVVTADPERFRIVGSKLLGTPIEEVTQVNM